MDYIHTHRMGLSHAESDRHFNGQPFIKRLHCELCSETDQLFESKIIQPRILHRVTQAEWVMTLVSAGLGMAIMQVT